MITSKPPTDEYRKGWDALWGIPAEGLRARFSCPCGFVVECSAMGVGTPCPRCLARVVDWGKP